jgi:MraZ protein
MGAFTGCYSISMDAKGRVIIPTKARDALVAACAGRIVVTADVKERCLLIYPESDWQELMSKIEVMPNLNEAARRLQRIMMGYATDMELDASGRILLTPTLRDYAHMNKKLMLLGQGKKFELWGEEQWHEWLGRSTDMGELTAAMENLSL